jgi:hypothetical protein
MMKYSLVLLTACLIFASCKKEFSLENYQPAQPVKEVRNYQLRAFYSDIPIDFIEYDNEVRSETDLWVYVKDYLKDDINEFHMDSTLVLIHQNDVKIPGNDEAVLTKSYIIGNDSEGMYMQFLGPEYEPLRYRLLEMNENYFIVYVKWRQGSTVYSRFERVW